MVEWNVVVNVEVDIGIEVGEEAARLDEDAIVDDDEDELGRELDIDAEEVVGKGEGLSRRVDVGGKAELEEELSLELNADDEDRDVEPDGGELEDVDAPTEVAGLDADVVMEVECAEDIWEADWDDKTAGDEVLLGEWIDIVVVWVLVEMEEEAAVFVVLGDGNREVELDDWNAGEDVELCTGGSSELGVSIVDAGDPEAGSITVSLTVDDIVDDAIVVTPGGVVVEIDSAAISPTKETPWQSSEPTSPKTTKSWLLVAMQKVLFLYLRLEPSINHRFQNGGEPGGISSFSKATLQFSHSDDGPTKFPPSTAKYPSSDNSKVAALLLSSTRMANSPPNEMYRVSRLAFLGATTT